MKKYTYVSCIIISIICLLTGCTSKEESYKKGTDFFSLMDICIIIIVTNQLIGLLVNHMETRGTKW